MDGSILEDVRVACNLNRSDSSFDGQLILHTNTFLFRLAQTGVGKKGFSIDSVYQNWSDFIDENFEEFEAVKSYVGLRVLLVFDPPQSSSVIELLNKTVDELGWTLYAEADVAEG